MRVADDTVTGPVKISIPAPGHAGALVRAGVLVGMDYVTSSHNEQCNSAFLNWTETARSRVGKFVQVTE